MESHTSANKWNRFKDGILFTGERGPSTIQQKGLQEGIFN